MGDVSIGTLTGRIELEDRFTSTIDKVLERVSALDEKFGGFGHRIAESAAGFFTAEAALEAVKEAAHLAAEELERLVETGGKFEDIEGAFDHLAASSGHYADELLGSVRSGMHGAITDMEVMSKLNTNMAAGMNLSEKQLHKLSEAAYALAQATGTDAAQAFDRVNDAMLTGRVRGIQLLTGKIDLADAEDRFAKSLNTTSQHLNAEGKIQSARLAILERLDSVSDRLGVVTLNLGDRVEITRAKFQNFELALGKAIAGSTVLTTGFDLMQAALGRAFGGSQEALVAAVAKKINEGAIAMVRFADTGVRAASVVGKAWYETVNTFTHAVEGIQLITYRVEQGIQLAAKLQQVISPDPTGRVQAVVKALTADMDRLYTSMAEGENTIAGNRNAEKAWDESLKPLHDSIKGIEKGMSDANKTVNDHEDALKRVTDATKGAANFHEKLADAVKQTGDYTKQTDEEIKAEAKDVDETTKLWAQYHELRVKHGGTTLEQQRAAIDTWYETELTKLKDSGNNWTKHYDALKQMTHEKMEDIAVDWQQIDDNTRGHFEDIARKAHDTFNEAIFGMHDVSREFIDKLRDDYQKADENVRNFGHGTKSQLKEIGAKAIETAEAIYKIIPPITQMLNELDKAEFDRLGGTAKLNAIEQSYLSAPGRKEGGTGFTNVSDEAGYIDLLNERKIYQQLKNYLAQHGTDDAPKTPVQHDPVAVLADNPAITKTIATVAAAAGFGPVHMTFHVNGTPEESAKKIGEIIMNKFGMTRRWS